MKRIMLVVITAAIIIAATAGIALAAPPKGPVAGPQLGGGIFVPPTYTAPVNGLSYMAPSGAYRTWDHGNVYSTYLLDGNDHYTMIKLSRKAYVEVEDVQYAKIMMVVPVVTTDGVVVGATYYHAPGTEFFHKERTHGMGAPRR